MKHFLFFMIFLFLCSKVFAVSNVTVCTQNLHNYGLYSDVKWRQKKATKETLSYQKKVLIKRFSDVGCDIIAFQELLGNDKSSNEAIKNFTEALKNYTKRGFNYYVGRSNDRSSRIGFLVAKDKKLKILSMTSYARRELPKLIKEERPRFFTRGPFEISLEVETSEKKKVVLTIITFHFKSKYKGYKDPSKTEWEILRMQSAEGLRQIAEEKINDDNDKKSSVVILLGDRNSDYTSASAKILEGVYSLSLFSKSFCKISKKGIPLCENKVERSPNFISVLTGDPETFSMKGSYIYKKKYSWIDEILISKLGSSYALESKQNLNNYDSGIFRKYEEASDHALGFVRLKF